MNTTSRYCPVCQATRTSDEVCPAHNMTSIWAASDAWVTRTANLDPVPAPEPTHCTERYSEGCPMTYPCKRHP